MKNAVYQHQSGVVNLLHILLRCKLDTNDIIDVSDEETLIHSLADTHPDMLLLNWRLYGTSAHETCRLIQQAYPCLKIVLLSVDANDAAAAKRLVLLLSLKAHRLMNWLLR
jgi:DNA-binding NarL/FixJ family response regulator